MKLHLISALPLLVCLTLGIRGMVEIGAVPQPPAQTAQHSQRPERAGNVESVPRGDVVDGALLAHRRVD